MAEVDPARLIIAGFRGNELPESYRGALRNEALGGIVLFSRNFDDAAGAAKILADAHAAQRQMLAAVDQEGGRVQRLKEFPLPAASVWRELGDVSLTEAAGCALGGFLRAVGFNLNFAPVVDVNTNPENPVIGDRAFGTDVPDVARYASAFAQGLSEAGVAACAKHFPGHGDTDTDSHLALPRLAHDMARLEAVELASFAEFTDLPAWMTAHILFSAIDDRYPATLSKSAIAIARETLGYAGVIISDDLEMNAIASHVGYAEASVAAIEAGCDALLICSEESAVSEASSALREHAARNPVFRSRVAEAWARVAAMIERYPMPTTSPQAWKLHLESEKARAFSKHLKDHGV